jgi:hypothetical protein
LGGSPKLSPWSGELSRPRPDVRRVEPLWRSSLYAARFAVSSAQVAALIGSGGFYSGPPQAQ